MHDLKIGKTGSMTDAKGNEVKFKIPNHVEVEETNHRLSDYPRKKISLQEIIFPDGRKSIRICYYLEIDRGWNYRQEPPFIQSSDLKELIEKAKNNGIL
jgi:hypothetical protein